MVALTKSYILTTFRGKNRNWVFKYVTRFPEEVIYTRQVKLGAENSIFQIEFLPIVETIL